MFQLDKLIQLVKGKKRVGRGGSRGGTSGKGHKGQSARTSGTVRRGFEGGQMPLSRRLPKRGFNNTKFQIEYEVVGLKSLEERFNEGDVITKEALRAKGLLKGRDSLVKILGGHDLKKKLIITADAFSKPAVEALKNVGGEAHLTKER